MVQTTTQSYMKRCDKYKEEIMMSKASAKWKALDETQGSTTAAGGSMSFPDISLPTTTMTNLGIPLTSGTTAIGFTIGFMKG